jgi:hypothetical protein
MQDRRRRGFKQLEHETDGLVLLQSQGQEVSNWEQSQPCDGCRILEGNWARQTHSRGKAAAVDRPAQDARVLQRPRTSRREDRLDHARVSPGRQPCRHDHTLCNARQSLVPTLLSSVLLGLILLQKNFSRMHKLDRLTVGMIFSAGRR